jgi:uncharacterized circularly permuted ATP-grasp superfamily protein/uncharacterized alpha-E superfamily protein
MLDVNRTASPEPSIDFHHSYPYPQGVYDEMCHAPGTPRPHWDYLVRCLEQMGPGDLGRRAEEARRLLRENGVTYNVYDDPVGMGRPWVLDLIPVLLTSQEWSVIERGLIQRAELLDLVLADLYGPRRLLHKGLLPPELVFGHPGFLRPSDKLMAAHHRLQFYVADLGRSPDGTLWVLGDRTQALAGAGYALENRIVLSRVLPSLYRDSHVHRLALFFRAMRAALTQLSPTKQDEPRIVLLTPGPGNAAYFEHAYLANYLGYALVQGGDLTVRDCRVWLKTLERLQPVDVILRRVDDICCDPLELRGDSLLGTPGLLQAARAGHVVIANLPGSGLLENPGLMPFLPAVCRYLLGRELSLPSVPTWWCGTASGLDYVLSHLDRLVVKPIYPHLSDDTVFGARLSAKQREVLADRIRVQPHLFVGQEQLALSTTPVLTDAGLAPRPTVLRSFLLAREDAYVVMPGGLARASPSADDLVVSSRRGGVSKDIWILASEPEKQVSLLPPAERPLFLSRSGGEVPSRVAENLFWLGRYAERLEGSVRLLREVVLRLVEPEANQEGTILTALLRAVTHQTGTYPGFVGDGAEQRLRNPKPALLEVILDTGHPGSVRAILAALMQVGRSVPDRLSRDAWRVINNLGDDLDQPVQLSAALEHLEQLLIALAAFAGLSTESMSRGQGWRFLDMGRRIERALQTMKLLRAMGVSAAAEVSKHGAGQLWEALLAVTDTIKTYRRRYRSQVQAGAVLDLLLHDESNPRSVAFQFVSLQEEVASLPRRKPAPHRSPEERLMLEAITALRLSDADELARIARGQAVGEGLEQILLRLSSLLEAFSDAISLTYFTHTEVPQQLVRVP